MGPLDCTSCQVVCGGTIGEGVLTWAVSQGPCCLASQALGSWAHCWGAARGWQGGRAGPEDPRRPTHCVSPHSPPRADNTCHFEDEKICGYTQDLTDNFDWTRQNALTQNPKRSPNTGPPTDVSGTPEGEDMAYY